MFKVTLYYPNGSTVEKTVRASDILVASQIAKFVYVDAVMLTVEAVEG